MAVRIPRRNIPQINTSAAARDYFEKLKIITDNTAEIVDQVILPLLPSLFATRDMLLDRSLVYDGIQDDIAAKIREAKARVIEVVTRRAQQIALAVSLETSQIQGGQQRAQFEAQGRNLVRESQAIPLLEDGFTIRNTGFIKSISNQELDRIGDIIANGLSTGQTLTDTTTLIRKEFDTAENRARLIAVNEVGTLTSSLSHARNTANAVEFFVWRTKGDNLVRKAHEKLNGRVFSWAQGAPGHIYPGGPFGCRCAAESFIQ